MSSLKNPSGITYFDPKRLNVQEEPDGASFISLLLCSAGMFMRNKLMIWIALFFILSTFCRKRNGTGIGQYLINLVMVVFGMVSLYVLVPPSEQMAAGGQ
jgi:hypothetical protein